MIVVWPWLKEYEGKTFIFKKGSIDSFNKMLINWQHLEKLSTDSL